MPLPNGDPTKAEALNADAIVHAKLLSLPEDVPPDPVAIDAWARTMAGSATTINHSQAIAADADMLLVFICANIPNDGTTSFPVTSSVTVDGVPMTRLGGAYANAVATYGRGVEAFALANPPTGAAVPIVASTPKPAGASANQSSQLFSMSLKNVASLGTPVGQAVPAPAATLSASTTTPKDGLVITGVCGRTSAAIGVSAEQTKYGEANFNTNIRAMLTSQLADEPAVASATMAAADMLAMFSVPVLNS